MGKYRSEENQQNKNKIMFGGILLVMAWMFFSPQLKESRVAVEAKGIKSYQNSVIVPNEVISAITDSGDIDVFTT